MDQLELLRHVSSLDGAIGAFAKATAGAYRATAAASGAYRATAGANIN